VPCLEEGRDNIAAATAAHLPARSLAACRLATTSSRSLAQRLFPAPVVVHLCVVDHVVMVRVERARRLRRSSVHSKPQVRLGDG